MIPDLPARPIESSFPCLWKKLCAVGRSKIAMVAPPSELTPPNRTVPTILNFSTGPLAITSIVSPTLKCWADAVLASIAISCGPVGQRPPVSESGLNRWSPFGLTLNARFGAPPCEITLPFRSTSCAWSWIPPSASATPGRLRTRARRPSGSDGGMAPLSALPPIALLPVITASVFLYTCVKTVLNAALIVSVRT